MQKPHEKIHEEALKQKEDEEKKNKKKEELIISMINMKPKKPYLQLIPLKEYSL